MGCYFQEGEEVKMNMTVKTAYRRSIETVIDWIGSEVNMSKTYVLFRTYAPVHFSGGDWNTGGGCHLETLPGLTSLPDSHPSVYKTLFDIVSERSNESHEIQPNLHRLRCIWHYKLPEYTSMIIIKGHFVRHSC
ncbi:protein trichome birefringence-like 10 isoform X2 [Prunus yedoensis var. nudiflora]|uniref:Protein trichome birefringence-like 10 isoform X2 n=1 Tax=Prunus yedoensis var. nudiflora TaxID=2094558 RepID=A0A314YN04_PRUYE|nr:protein trichome birefringence-like 10 isoform X2 [Prunus yedoensis var. nudiflora]